jgi:hypothetical protein
MYYNFLDVVTKPKQVVGKGTNPTTGGGIGGEVDLSNGCGINPPYFDNFQKINESRVELIYNVTDSSNLVKHYGSYDQTKELARFQPIGIVFTLLFFSIYLYYVSEKLLKLYFNSEIVNKSFYIFFYFVSFILIVGWVAIVFLAKGIPSIFIPNEILNYPSQFILGMILANLLLLGIGIFKFILVAFVSDNRKSKTLIRDQRFSFIAIIFGILSAITNFYTLWSAFK